MADTGPKSLYSLHPRALALLFGDVENHAAQQLRVFVGPPGSINERKNSAGFRFYAHQTYDGDGKRRENYVAGPVGDPEAEAKLDALRAKIREAKELTSSLRLLGREGFNLVDRKTYATLAVLHNHGVFAAGGLLVGSHAFGVLLNRLGVRATPYSTEDIDLARRETLAFDPALELSLLEMLRESGLAFFEAQRLEVEVPGFDPKAPSTSYKEQGRSSFRVDLLVPTLDETVGTFPVPELKAHATGLPYLSYLLEESQQTALLAREGACTVRVPLPERFAVHKLIVSQLRTGRTAKSDKDIFQACVLAAALGDTHPGAIEDAVARAPEPALRHLRRALEVAGRTLEPLAPRAWEEFQAAL